MTTVVNFGGGVNSLAILVGLYERARRPDVVIFADTRGEKPETYESNARVNAWLEAIGFPCITVVSDAGRRFESLEDECLKLKTLPSRAFGFGRCADHWKRRPIERWLKANTEGEITQAIGYDAGEARRVKSTSMPRSTLWYPLIEWQWGREECTAAIERAGLVVPPKSSCFFCPSMKKREILALPEDLKARAVAMESNADLTHVAGLGRSFAWRALIKADASQLRMFPESTVENCMVCADGEAA